MPKIFLIKTRLHQQQLRLLESQNLLHAKDEDRLVPHHVSEDHYISEPLPLVARKNKDKYTG